MIVSKLVEGETLAQRLTAGPLPVNQALTIGRQVADAVQAAHEKGITHRDLKPANIALTHDGQVKVLDFGLAKNVAGGPGRAGGPGALNDEFSQSPTMASPTMMTGVGVILGTAAYMSPEQAKGRAADKRSDVWAFGCVLYELLTGTRAFEGEDVSDTLGAVLRGEPNWAALPADVPPAIRTFLQRCLEKDRSRRVADISTALFVIDEQANPANPTDPANLANLANLANRVPLWRRAIPAVLAALVIAAVAGGTAMVVLGSSRRAVRHSVLRVSARENRICCICHRYHLGPRHDRRYLAGRRQARIYRPRRVRQGHVVDSPDRFADGAAASGHRRCFVPILVAGQPVHRVFCATEAAQDRGGRRAAQTLCTGVDGNRGGAWNPDGTIVFNTGPARGLSRVSSAGGQASEFMHLTNGQIAYAFPWFLPDGRHFLFYGSATSDDVAGVYVGSLDAAESKRLVGADTSAVYDTRSGHLLFVRQGTLLAQPFNLKTLALTGDSFPIAERVESNVVQGISAFSVSNTGVLAYGVGAGSAGGLQMAWFDRHGKQLEAVGPPANYRGLDLSPDGQRVAAHRHDGVSGDVWVTDLSRNTTSRFTFDASQENSSPIWSPEGTRIVYGSFRSGKYGLYQKLANNAGTEERLLESDIPTLSVSWSPDGNSIVYEVSESKTSLDLWVLPLTGDRKPSPLLRTPFAESHGQISPDGKWFAYKSNETGRNEVYVQPFPSGAGKWQISTSGGEYFRWRRDGRELFYMSQASGGKMMAVDVKSSGSKFEAGAPKELFDSPYINLPHLRGGIYHTFAVSADGQRFLIPHPPSSDAAVQSMPIAVVMNWAAGLKK